jgi:hypothetical protein
VLQANNISVVEKVLEWQQHMFAEQTIKFLSCVSKAVGGNKNLTAHHFSWDKVQYFSLMVIISVIST